MRVISLVPQGCDQHPIKCTFVLIVSTHRAVPIKIWIYVNVNTLLRCVFWSNSTFTCFICYTQMERSSNKIISRENTESGLQNVTFT